jgi:hypothetical protein
MLFYFYPPIERIDFRESLRFSGLFTENDSILLMFVLLLAISLVFFFYCIGGLYDGVIADDGVIALICGYFGLLFSMVRLLVFTGSLLLFLTSGSLDI